MKAFLLHRDQDFRVKPELDDPIFEALVSGDLFAIVNVRRKLERERKADALDTPLGRDGALTQDLELATLWRAMGAGDEFVIETAKRVVLSSLTDPDTIVYRQRALADCMRNPETVRGLYALAMEALESVREVGSPWPRDRPDMILSRSVRLLGLHVNILRRLRQVGEQHASSFESEGFTRFFAMLRDELSDDYLATVERHLLELEFKPGVLAAARLGKGNKARRYVVRRPRPQSWKERLVARSGSRGYSFQIHPRDESGARALEEIRGKAINRVANAAAQSADHVKSFFAMLRLELAFYLGCLNLWERLDGKGEPTCLPEPRGLGGLTLEAQGIYDVCLTLHLEDRAVGNDVDANGKALVMITGANQGGKSTLLRSLGLAHLMMQCGMFVGARSFRADVANGVFTHYKREEDATMERGKLDEELRRMSLIADEITAGSIVLCNESFASTNEREGSEIARQVVRAMLDNRIKVVFVTHMYDLASGLHDERLDTALFLRAERQDDGRRTFKLRVGEPLPTSYGADSFRRIFGATEAQHGAAGDTAR